MIADSATRAPAVPAPPGVVVRLLLAPLLGVVAASALPPWSLLPGLVGLTGLVAAIHVARGRWEALALGWLWGVGWFGVGLYWVAIAFYADPERFGAMAIPAVTGLVLACALFPAAAAWLTRLRRWRRIEATALVFAAAWATLEPLRGHAGVQFPWNPLSVVWSASTPIRQNAAWIGAPGLTLLTLVVAGLAAGLIVGQGRDRWRGPLIAALLAAALLAIGEARLAFTHEPAATGVALRLVQADIPQKNKWDPKLRAEWFRRHLDLSARPATPPPAAIVWPESAVPFLLEREPIVRDMIGKAVPAGGYVLTGGDRLDLDAVPPLANNSLFALGEGGTVVARYDKVDLVPFGEFLPFRPLLAIIGFEKLAQGTFDFISGPSRRTIALPGLPSFSPLICYEAIYSGDAVARDAARPHFLLNITNDAWFGRSPGPYQHLAMARMRAVEEGLPLVRDANSGFTVVTDIFGRTLARLDLDTIGVLDVELPGRLEHRPFYARHGRRVVAALILICVALGWIADGRRPIAPPG